VSPKALAKVISQAALAQLKVAVDQRVVLSVDTAELLAIAIGAGAAQHLSMMDDDTGPVEVVETPEVRELLSRSRFQTTRR
jgi:hypothetical protein